MQRFHQPSGILFPAACHHEKITIAAKYIADWRLAIAELISVIEDWLSPLQAGGKLKLLRSSHLVTDPISEDSYHVDQLEILVNGSKRLSLVPVSAAQCDQPGRISIQGLKQETVLLLRKINPLAQPSWQLVFDESSPKTRVETQLSHGIMFTLLARMIQ